MKTCQLMGIVNVTPDSAFAASRTPSTESAILRGVEIVKEGADILDIGGESTRPNAAPVSEEEELRRVIPVITALKALIPIPISIDTSKPKVAIAALDAGASFLNDVTGFEKPEMRKIAADAKVPICIMHMQGNPTNMQDNPFYEEGIVANLVAWFSRRIELCLKENIQESQIILDPGIGFGKTVADNLQIIQNLPKLKALGFPILLGVSRKWFLTFILNKPREEVLPATLAINTVAILAGVNYIRVHDVKEHRDIINVLNFFKRNA